MVHMKLTAKSPDKHSQQVRETNRDCFVSEHVIRKFLYIQPLIRALMNHCFIWNRSVSGLSLCKQPFKSYNLSRGMHKEKKLMIGNMQLQTALYNLCVSSTKLKQTMKGSLCYSKSIYIHLRLNRSILQELWIFFACN